MIGDSAMQFPSNFQSDDERRRARAAGVIWILFWTFGLYCAVSGNLLSEWRLNNLFVQTEAVVLHKDLVETQGDERWEYEAKFLVRYPLQGAASPYETWAGYHAYSQPSDRASAKARLDHFSVGEKYPCWYDPANPRTVAMSRSYTAQPFVMIFICAAVLGVSFLWIRWR